MAYSSYGKKVYASIKDLPQYTSIENGDKIIIWNETRDGAAVVDFGDLIIDLEHTTFKSTINEVVTLASDVQTFAHTVSEEITGLEEAVTSLQNTIDNEILNRIKVLEFMIAIILGANSKWLSASGLDTIRNDILLNGISQSENINFISGETEEQKNTLRWYYGYISTLIKYISKLIPGIEESDILLQPKLSYNYKDTQLTE